MITPNTYFDQIYVINLPRRPDKLTKVLKQLDRYHIQAKVMDAVDGYHPEFYYQQKKLPKGAYGYVLSWENVILDAIRGNFKKILILDDDVMLKRDFSNLFSQWISDMNETWKVLLLGATQHTLRPPLIGNLNAYYPNVIDGSFAVGVDQSIFQEILTELQGKDQYVDSDILRFIYRSYPKQCFVAYPNLIIADVTDSDIRDGRSQEQLAKKVGWNLPDYHWPNQRPLVSVIIPCYQAEKTIKRCLKSMLDQTYRPLEIVLVDDGTTDDSLKIISNVFNKWQYDRKAKDLTYKLIRHSTNQGCYAARNTGLANSKGELIAFQDADDISLDYRIEDQVNALYEYQVKFTTCLFLRTHLPYLSENPIQLKKDIHNTRIHHRKHCCRARVGLATTVFRREIFEKHGDYPLWKWGADDQYIRNLFPKIDQNYKMMNFLDENEYIPKLYYRVSKVLYLSHEMTHQNLTQQRLRAQKED